MIALPFYYVLWSFYLDLQWIRWARR